MQIGEGVSPPNSSSTAQERELCELCKKDKHRFADSVGNHIGSGSVLSRKIVPSPKDHKWYSGGFSLQAHHLTCSEAKDDDQWAKVCSLFGYEIDRKENGVMLPGKMPLACQLFAPLHRSGHEKGSGGGSLSYPAKAKQLVAKYKNKALSGGYCGNIGQLVKDLDVISSALCYRNTRH